LEVWDAKSETFPCIFFSTTDCSDCHRLIFAAEKQLPNRRLALALVRLRRSAAARFGGALNGCAPLALFGTNFQTSQLPNTQIHDANFFFHYGGGSFDSLIFSDHRLLR
jgi:hypothetical protein